MGTVSGFVSKKMGTASGFFTSGTTAMATSWIDHNATRLWRRRGPIARPRRSGQSPPCGTRRRLGWRCGRDGGDSEGIGNGSKAVLASSEKPRHFPRYRIVAQRGINSRTLANLCFDLRRLLIPFSLRAARRQKRGHGGLEQGITGFPLVARPRGIAAALHDRLQSTEERDTLEARQAAPERAGAPVDHVAEESPGIDDQAQPETPAAWWRKWWPW